MQLSRLTAGVGVGLSLVVVVAATRPGPSPARSAKADAGVREVHRIQIHLDSALALLDAGGTSRLSDRQRARRHAAIETLQTYRDSGVFPHNYDFAELTPYFVDRKTGTLCAVAYLLESSGRHDIVARVARTNNNVRVRQLAGDTAFTNWLDENGLSLDEAAFVQVIYARQPSEAGVIAGLVGVGAAIPTVTTGLWNLSTNRDGHRPYVSGIGLAAGLVSFGAGVQMRMSSDPSFNLNPIAATSMMIGASAIALSIHSMVQHSAVVAKEKEANRRTISEASISPFISPNLSRTGMTVSLHF